MVFDAKTVTAIEAGKNRITLLQAEELRLNKLNQSLEARLITLTNDIASKEKTEQELTKSIETLQAELTVVDDQLVSTLEEKKQIEVDLRFRLDEINKQVADLKEREVMCDSLSKELNTKKSALAAKESDLDAKELTLKTKQNLLQEVINKL